MGHKKIGRFAYFVYQSFKKKKKNSTIDVETTNRCRSTPMSLGG
jgi:hypothetical protein